MAGYFRPMRDVIALSGVALAGSPVSAAATLGAPFAASGVLPGIQPRYLEVGDWLVACDNTRKCIAKYVPADRDGDTNPYDEDAGLTISRKAGPSGAVSVDATSGRRFDPATIHVDAAAADRSLRWKAYDEGRGARIDGAAAVALVRGMRNAETVSWSDSQHRIVVSLRGLAAVLVAMDEAQGRIGNVDALGRPGPRSASTAPAAVAPPIVRRGPKLQPMATSTTLVATLRRTQAAVLKSHGCDQEAGTDDSADRLDGHRAIVLLGCGRFAYQTSVLAFLVPLNRPEAAKLLILPTPMSPAAPDPDAIGEYVGGGYDANTRVFSTYAKGRGMADCGESAEWTWDGVAFRLTAHSLQQRCGGGPGNWPTLFRTRAASSS